MRAITLWRPWSDAIIHGPKRIENRTWAPPRALLGHTIAIHSGKTWDADIGCGLRAMGSGWSPPMENAQSPQGVIGVARLVGFIDDAQGVAWGRAEPSSLLVRCLRETAQWDARIAPRLADPWWMGPVGWIFDEPLALTTPIACRGAQGLWTVPADVARQIGEQTLAIKKARASAGGGV